MMELHNIEDINFIERPTIVTVGMFDGVHLGHRQLLRHLAQQASALALQPIVVTFDRHPRQVLDKNYVPRMLCTFDERLELLSQCGVQHVVVASFDRAMASMSACSFARDVLCNKLNMNALLLGYDNVFGSRLYNDFAQLPDLGNELGFKVVRDQAVSLDGVEVSSTKIRHCLMEGDIEKATAMLGSPYSIEGPVVHGRHVGTGLGFPTANIHVADPNKLLPKQGVYALRAICNGQSYAAMANLGAQPTFHQNQIVFEVHLLDFNGELYGNTMQLCFLHRMRDIVNFPSPEALIEQLGKDAAEAKLIYFKAL